MGTEQSRPSKPSVPDPDSQPPHRKAMRSTAFQEWVEQMSRPVASSPVSSSPQFQFGARGESPARPKKNTRSNTNSVFFDMATKLQAKHKELQNAQMILETQEKRLSDLKEQEEMLGAKKTRNAAENEKLKEIREEIAFLEKYRPDLFKTVRHLSDEVERAESQSKWSWAAISEAIMTAGRLFFSFSPAPDEKSAGERRYVMELSMTFFVLIIPVLVATVSHLNQLDPSAKDHSNSVGNTHLVAYAGVVAAVPACILLDKVTPLSLNRQRVLMIVAIVVYYGLFAYVITKMAKGSEILLCNVANVGCVTNTTNTTQTILVNKAKTKSSFKPYIKVLKDELMGPDSEFVFSLLCAATGAVDNFLTGLYQTSVCSVFEQSVIAELKTTWNDDVARYIFSILTVPRIQKLLDDKSVTTHNTDRNEHGFFINIDLGHYQKQEVFVSTSGKSGSESATRFLWFLRYINSAINNNVLECKKQGTPTLGRGDPYGIAASILRSLFDDTRYNSYTATEILNGKNPLKDSRVQSIVDYMQKYPDQSQTLSTKDQTKAKTLIENAKLSV